MKIQLFVTGQPEVNCSSVEELLEKAVKIKRGWWPFVRTNTYKLTSFKDEISQAVAKNPEVLKLNFSETMVTINAFAEKGNVFSKSINI